MHAMYPQKSLVLCEPVDSEVTEKPNGLIVPKDKMSSGSFSVYRVVKFGDDLKDFYKKGELIVVDDEHLNSFFYQNKMYYFIDDGFIALKIKVK